MYVAAGVVVFLYIFLGVLSRKETMDLEIGFLLRPFYKISLYLYKRACIHKVPLLFNGQVEKDLEKLYPGERRKQMCTEYYVRKLAKTLLICLVGTFLGLIVSVQAEGNRILSDAGAITRGTYEEGAKDVEVECSLQGGTQKFAIQVGAESFDEEEIKKLYASFCRELSDYILGENASLHEVRQNLYLVETYEGYPFAVSWESNHPDIVHSDGIVSNTVEEVQEVELRANISYEEWEWEESFFIQVMPRILSQEEKLHLDIENLLIDSERNSRTENVWQLPDSWQGQELEWSQSIENNGPIFWIGGVLVAFLVYSMADRDLHDEVEKRKQLMKREYSDVVHKLVLYLGAGMTIRGAFHRMAEEYEQDREKGKDQCPVYEELLHMCRELKAGTSEGAAYEHFGNRTGLQEYIRLSTLLTQNLKKGNSTILQRLREEAAKASEERLQYGKRLGEEAMTKLLLPMVMMLLVVMLIIMIPAFSSVGT